MSNNWTSLQKSIVIRDPLRGALFSHTTSELITIEYKNKNRFKNIMLNILMILLMILSPVIIFGALVLMCMYNLIKTDGLFVFTSLSFFYLWFNLHICLQFLKEEIGPTSKKLKRYEYK